MNTASPAPRQTGTLQDPLPSATGTLQDPLPSATGTRREPYPGTTGSRREPHPGTICTLEESDRGDAGQTTAEYALVLLGAAALAAVLIKWATSSSGLIKLFTAVIRKLVQGVAG
jgi:uncharacterized protein DUF4244